MSYLSIGCSWGFCAGSRDYTISGGSEHDFGVGLITLMNNGSFRIL